MEKQTYVNECTRLYMPVHACTYSKHSKYGSNAFERVYMEIPLTLVAYCLLLTQRSQYHQLIATTIYRCAQLSITNTAVAQIAGK